MAGRLALSEVEITPEMIDAGVDRLLDYSINFDDPSEVVRQVLASCLSVASVNAVRSSILADRREMARPPSGAKSG